MEKVQWYKGITVISMMESLYMREISDIDQKMS
jgi:sulfate adenylyltransferase subunit 1 (EFTu-like GTPase family)